MKSSSNAQPVVALNPITMKAKFYPSYTSAAKALNRDVATIRSAATGYRGSRSAANHFIIPVDGLSTEQ
jgi:hypothetical protein